MTVAELLADQRLREHEYPVVRERIYLAHAGVCPLPRRVADAVRSFAEHATLDDQETCLAPPYLAETRALAARLLSAQTNEIAFVGPTSAALSTVAAGLNLRRGANVVVYLDDYPSNVYPWMAMSDRGIEVRFLKIRELGQIRPADVLGHIDEATGLVALASCHFISGYRIDLASIGRALRQRGILFCVDAIQTLGAFPTPVEWADCLAADSHKWLLGPTGAGILWVRHAVQDRIQPVHLGWHNVRCPDFIAQEKLVFRHDARRYEAGSQNLLGLVGLRAALELALELGIDSISSELRRQRAWLVNALTERNCQILNPGPSPENASGIVSFRKVGVDAAAIHAKLAAGGVVASLRTDRTGCRYVRFSPHYYVAPAELEAAVALV